MQEKVKLKDKWRRLDNSAKIFPIVSNKKFSTVFRFSAVLNEEIDKHILEVAVKNTVNQYDSFKVKLKKGFFWYYFEFNNKEPIVEEEKNYPCKYIDQNANNDYLFKVTYFKNKINIDVFHSLTDGNSAIHFFREIIYNYIELSHSEDTNFMSRGNKEIVENNTEDSYMKNYNKKIEHGNVSNKKAFILKGKVLPLYAIGVQHQIIDLEALKEECKKQNVTVTQYLTAVLIKAIYEGNYKKYNSKSKKPIKVCIPVNLKKYFPSTTLANFFSYITIEADVKNGKIEDFSKVLEFVKNSFKEKLTEEEVTKTMSSNVKLGNNFFVRIVPLFLKKVTVKISYMEIRKYTTTTFSNIGRIGILPEYKKYIKEFLFLIAPEPVEKIKCSACSYEDKIVFTFTSTLEDLDIQNAFYKHFKENNINVEIESNGVYDTIS